MRYMVRRKRKNKNLGKIMAIFIAVVMVGSIAGYVILDSDSQSIKEYNGYKFKQSKYGFYTEINDIKVNFNFHPSDAEQISFTDEGKEMLKNVQVLAITSDKGNKLQRAISLLEFELENNLMQFGKIAYHGFTEENENNLPVITCANATSGHPVIYINNINKGNETKIDLDNNCFRITAESEYDIVKIKDVLLYRILGIIE